MGRANHEAIDPNNHLEIARKHLETGSGVGIFNHFKGDFFLWARFMGENLTPLDNITALVGMKYLDPTRSLTSRGLSYMFPKWEAAFGVKVLPLVQSYDRASYPDANSINTRTLKQAVRILKTPGKIIAIAPEGTRSKDGGLSEAEEGVGLILKLSKSLAIPLAAEHSESSNRQLLGSTNRIHVGKPFFIEEIEEEQRQNPDMQQKDLIMQRVAELLPEEKRGHYRQLT